MTFRVVDAGGGVADEGKDLLALQRRLAGRTQDAVASAVRTAVRAAMEEARAAASSSDPAAAGTGGAGGAGETSHASRPSLQSHARRGWTGDDEPARTGIERDGLTTWPDDLTLPDAVETAGPAGTIRAYPALADPTAASEEGDPRTSHSSDARGVGVAVRVLATEAAARDAHRRGLRRLLLLDVGLATARITSRWAGNQALALATSPYPSTDALVTDVQLAALDALVPHAETVRDKAAYDEVRALTRDALEDEVHRLVGVLVDVLTAWREADRAVRESTSLPLVATARDVRIQVAALVADGFVVRTGAARLPHLTRYLRAATLRLAKAAENPHRDQALAAQVREVQQAYDEAVTRAAAAAPDPARDRTLDAVRWQLEELRVSLFAQQLGTPEKVSEQRIRKALAAL
jgi:ATP-dependent helicase HrpA